MKNKFCRHFSALMRKNLIIYRRNPCSSLCMLIAPLVMMYIMVILRNKISVTSV